MAIGYHRLNSSAARRRISSGRPEKGCDTGSGQYPDWMTANAIFQPGDAVFSESLGDGVVTQYALTTVAPVEVAFASGKTCLVSVSSIARK